MLVPTQPGAGVGQHLDQFRLFEDEILFMTRSEVENSTFFDLPNHTFRTDFLVGASFCADTAGYACIALRIEGIPIQIDRIAKFQN